MGNLDTTNGQLEDEDSETYYAEFQDYDCESITDVLFHGSEITCDSDDLSEFTYWNDNYYHSEDDLTNCPECGARMLEPEYYRNELFYSELTEEYYCCQGCKEKAELQYKKDNWFYSALDSKYYENAEDLTTYNAWNPELNIYEPQNVCIDMVDVFVNCEILFRIGNELYDEINEQTEQPLGVPVVEEALIEA